MSKIKDAAERFALAELQKTQDACQARSAKTWQEELAAGVFENGLVDAGLDRHDFKDISKQTLKKIIDAAYARGLAEGRG